jgi:hypothetical protein
MALLFFNELGFGGVDMQCRTHSATAGYLQYAAETPAGLPAARQRDARRVDSPFDH